METLTKRRKRKSPPPIERPQENRLREVRRAKDKTLQQCAKAIGTSYQAIHKAEKRKDAMVVSKWIELAEFLETPLNELVTL